GAGGSTAGGGSTGTTLGTGGSAAGGGKSGTGTSSTLGAGGSTAGSGSSGTTLGTGGSSAGSSQGTEMRNEHRFKHGKHRGTTEGNSGAPGLR
ncbi:MAG TPA: hypothetical protein VJR70_09590, partial [Stellaceae bacterium]|nr:hypothetical protein [Stellaceae bacterium]